MKQCLPACLGLITFWGLSSCYSPKAHDALLDHAFRGRLNTSSISTLKAESRAFDKATQSTAECYKHAMASKNIPPVEAAKLRDEFVDGRIKEARRQAIAQNSDSALKSLAHGLHTLMDSSSPMHTGKDGMPLVWDPWWPWGHSPFEAIGHERVRDLTPAVYKKQDGLLNNAFDQAFKGTPSYSKVVSTP